MSETNGRTPSKTAKILYLDHTACLGGGEIALWKLLCHLDTTRFHPVILLGSDGPLRTKLCDGSFETHLLPLPERILRTRKDALGYASFFRLRDIAVILSYARRLAHFIKANDIQIIHTNSLKSDIIGGLAGRFAGVPVIWHVRDRIESDYLPPTMVRLFRRLSHLLPDYVIAISQATLETLRPEGVSPPPPSQGGRQRGQCLVVHDGVEPDTYYRPPTTEAQEPHTPLVGMIGRISPWKGQDVFLRAAAKVHQRFPQIRYPILGAALFAEQQYEADIHTLCAQLGLTDSVEWLGFREDAPQLLQTFDILVHASVTGEPFGQVILEGMMAGKPVVATRGGGVPEIMQDGVTGILVPMKDPDAMAEAICRLLADPEQAQIMGQRGRQRALEQFTIQHTVQRVERLYEQILG